MWRTTSSSVVSRLRNTACRKSGKQKLCTNAPPPPPVPQEPARKGGALVKVLGVTVLASSGVVGYAWYDQKFRKTLEDNIPYSKDAFGYLFSLVPSSSPATVAEPEVFPKQRVIKVAEVQDQPPAKAPAQPVVKKEVKEEPKPEKKPEKSEKQLKKEEEARLKAERKRKEEEDKALKKAEIERQLREKETKEAAENAVLESILDKLGNLVKQRSEDVLALQTELIEKIKTHTDLLKVAMDESAEVMDKDTQWQNVTEAFSVRQDLANKAEELSNSAKEEISELVKTIKEAKQNVVLKKNKALKSAEDTVNKATKELNKMNNKVTKCETESKVLLKYKDLIAKGKKQFQQEMESIMPDVKYSKGKKLTEEELNSMIAYCQRRIEQLTKQMAEQVAMEQQRLELALDQQRSEDEKFAQELVATEIQSARVDFNKDMDKKETEVRVECEQEKRQELARKDKAHIEHLRDILQVREKELLKEFEQRLNMTLLHERKAFQNELAGWMARIQGIEKAIDDRAEAEKSVREAQELWLACVALRASIEKGTGLKGEWEDQLRPLQLEVNAVDEASGNHPFVTMVLDTIPQEALTKGVWTEENLQSRFWGVKRICKRVARIGEEGGSLYQYLVSYIQSFLVWTEVVYKKETDEVDISTMDTFSIVAHAEHFIRKGNFEQAVRYMNLLTGEPRRVAEDWLREAKLLLETRQAAYSLIAFASASGIGTFY